MEQRVMTNTEAEQHFAALVSQIKLYAPDEIIAVARSGCALAQWVAEELNLQVGFFEPRSLQFVHQPSSKRYVFVDDNCVSGETYLNTAKWFNTTQQGEMKFAVLFSDRFKTPLAIQQQILQGTVLEYFAVGPVWSSRKKYTAPYVRRRDE